MGNGMTVTLVKSHGEQEVLADFEIVSVPYMDLIFKLRRRYILEIDDQLKLDFSVPVVSRVEVPGVVDRETNRYTEDWRYTTGELKKEMSVTHFRFTKIGEDAWIELMNGITENVYTPRSPRAQKIR